MDYLALGGRSEPPRYLGAYELAKTPPRYVGGYELLGGYEHRFAVASLLLPTYLKGPCAPNR